MSYKHKRSDVPGKVPVAADFKDGEILVNTADGRAFINTPGGVETLPNKNDVSVLAGFRNKIINGDFDVWQRGEGPHTGFGYTADRWDCYKNSATELASVSRQMFPLGGVDVPGSPAGYLRASVTNGGNAAIGYISIAQQIEDVRTLAGVKATLTFYARVNTPREVAIELSQIHGSGGSPRLNILVGKAQLATTWKKFSYVIDVPSLAGKTLGSNHSVGIAFVLSAGTDFAARTGNIGIQTGVFDFARVSLVEGDASAEDDPFSPRHIQQELALCQRYYEVLSGISVSGYSVAAAVSYATYVAFNVRKRVTPTLAVLDWGETGNVTNQRFGYPSMGGASFFVTAVGAGAGWMFGANATADAEL